jgi:hypothetical protein
LRDMQHDSNSAAGAYEGGGAQAPKSMMYVDLQHMHETYRPYNVRLQPRSDLQSFGGDFFLSSRFLRSLMTPTGPTACTRQQRPSGRHMNAALPHI